MQPCTNINSFVNNYTCCACSPVFWKHILISRWSTVCCRAQPSSFEGVVNTEQWTSTSFNTDVRFTFSPIYCMQLYHCRLRPSPACRRALLGFFPFVHHNNNKRIREVYRSIHNRYNSAGKPPQLYLPVIMLLLITRKLLSELTSYASSFTATQVGWR